MKKEIRLAITSAACCAVIAISGISTPAHAQWAVHDNANLVKAIEAARARIQQIEEARRQIEEAQKLYESVNGITDLSDIAEIMDDPQMRGGLPDGVRDVNDYVNRDANIGGIVGARAEDILDETDYQLGQAGSDYQQQQFESAAREASRDRALAEIALENSENRAQGIGELNERLRTAETQKEVLDLQARATIEAIAATNETNRLLALEAQQQAEAERRSVENTARLNRNIRRRREFISEKFKDIGKEK